MDTTLTRLLEAAIAARPNEPALADAGNRDTFAPGPPRRHTWVGFDQAVRCCAASLADLGVGSGDRVAIQLPNVAELPILILACARLGAVAVPFPIQHRGHELRHGFATAGVTLAVSAPRPDRPEQMEVIAGVAGEFGATVASIDPAYDGAVIDVGPQVPGAVPVAPSAEVGPDAVATVCWTSGTTGTPKGVPRTHSMWGETARFQVDALGLTAEDRILCPFPLVNMAGIGGMLVPWLLSQSALILHQPLDLPVFLHQLQAERITYTVAPPPLLNMLLRNEALMADLDTSALRIITSGSAPLDPWMIEGWEARGVEICNAFGSNEGVSMLSTRATVPDPAQRARLFPAPNRHGVEARLVDLGTGAEITDVGEPGELLFRGPTVFDGYLGSDGSEFLDGWLRSGDIFEWATPPDADGRRLLRFVDRAKDIIIRGGMNVSAAEVEALISAHPGVAECAVVGFPDPDLGERVGVFIVTAPDADPPDLDDVVAVLRAADVASYKLPERLEVIDALPRNPVGKVVKPELRAVWERQVE
jgi:acyl-CoA synthetase (AMP-forming)/AMP-acid ligase II